MRPVTRAGRWAWGLCGLATAAALAVPGTRLIVSAGIHSPATAPRQVPRQTMARIQTRTVTVPQLVTSLNVRGYAGPIQVTAAPVTHVQVTETIAYFGTPPAVVQSVSGGRLLLADPACANDSCSVSFAVKVPLGVTVTASGGPLFISGTSGANLDSGGAPVSATKSTARSPSHPRGAVQINGLTGPLRADTGSGPVIATRVSAATAVVTTGSGPCRSRFPRTRVGDGQHPRRPRGVERARRPVRAHHQQRRRPPDHRDRHQLRRPPRDHRHHRRRAAADQLGEYLRRFRAAAADWSSAD